MFGMSDAHHFRKMVGVSPADFRRTFAARSAVAGH